MSYQQTDMTELKDLLSAAQEKLRQLQYDEAQYLAICHHGYVHDTHKQYFENSMNQLNDEIRQLQREIRRRRGF